LRNARIWLLRRYDVAASNAASLASVPDVVTNTLASGMPERADSLSASSTSGRLRYSVDVCSIFPACSRSASTTSGTAWPEIVVRMPPKKSR